jgi:hypothetical protein
MGRRVAMTTNPHLESRLKKEYSSGPSYHLTVWTLSTQLCTQSVGRFPDAGHPLPAIYLPLLGRPSCSPPQYRLRRPISYHYNVGMSQLLFPAETDLKLKCHLYHLSGELRLIRFINFTGRAPHRSRTMFVPVGQSSAFTVCRLTVAMRHLAGPIYGYVPRSARSLAPTTFALRQVGPSRVKLELMMPPEL